MKLVKIAALAPFALMGEVLLAQAPVATPTSTSAPENYEEVVGTADNDAKIAIPAFATNADTLTQTSAGSTSALGMSLAYVIYGDLKNNGLFKPTGPASLPRPALAQVQEIGRAHV